MLKLFQRREWLPEDAAEMMRGWEHGGGFSVNAEVWVPSWDRARLERLLRYCARPVFASERLAWLEPDRRLVYHLPKPKPDGQTVLYLTPLEFMDRLAALIPPPRKHRHRYHGVLAPNSPLRLAVTAYAGLSMDTPGSSLPDRSDTPPKPATDEPTPTRSARYLWVALIARIYAILPLICPECGGEMRLIAFITEAEPLRRILAHLDEPVKPPPISPARSPPDEAVIDWDLNASNDPERVDPAPEFEFDQTVSW